MEVGSDYYEGNESGCCFDGEEDRKNWDSFVVVEPSFQIELNVTQFLRINVGAGWRFVTGVEKYDLSNSDIGGPSVNFILKFGRF